MTIIEYLQSSCGTDHIREEMNEKVCPYNVSDDTEVIIEPDGYARCSKVQGMYMAVDYKKRLIRRILLIVLAIIVFFVIFWAFWKIGFIKI